MKYKIKKQIKDKNKLHTIVGFTLMTPYICTTSRANAEGMPIGINENLILNIMKDRMIMR